MAGFLRKVAGAFIEFDDSPQQAAEKFGSTSSDSSLDAISRDADDLFVQLEKKDSMGNISRKPGPIASSPIPNSAEAPASSSSGGSVLSMNADQVFADAQIADGPNSARKMLKLIGGLSMFPKAQQIAAIRAMDEADDSWSETAVLEDARLRQSALRRHLETIEAERGGRLAELAKHLQLVQSERDKILETIDSQIAELQRQRETAVVETTKVMSDIEQQKKDLEIAADTSRRSITEVINTLSQLITFFGNTTDTLSQNK